MKYQYLFSLFQLFFTLYFPYTISLHCFSSSLLFISPLTTNINNVYE